MKFFQIEPTIENYWRGIILFGRNVASYKFALAQSLLDLSNTKNDQISLEELALPFSKHICRHLNAVPKQSTSTSSRFLDACDAFNQKRLNQSQLIDATLKLGFNNVIDAFHNINNGEIDIKFYKDDRKISKSIYLTDNFYLLCESPQFKNLFMEADARWKLVEHAWQLGLSQKLISVGYDDESRQLFTLNKNRRVNITSCRDSLNGYQKGRCFYCYRPVRIDKLSSELADVDHFIPWMSRNYVSNINGIWNLVLACQQCNRGKGGKFTHIPSLKLLERLHIRNEYFINSHLPLRETLIAQSGRSEELRRRFLNDMWLLARNTMMLHCWEPEAYGDSIF